MLASSTVTSISDGHFDMSVLNRLDKVAGISIFNHLAPKFLTMAAALSLDKPTFENLKRMGNNPCEGSRAMLKEWISGKSPLPPTWNVLLSMVRLQREDLAQEIEDFFNRTPVTEDISVSLVMKIYWSFNTVDNHTCDQAMHDPSSHLFPWCRVVSLCPLQALVKQLLFITCLCQSKGEILAVFIGYYCYSCIVVMPYWNTKGCDHEKIVRYSRFYN